MISHLRLLLLLLFAALPAQAQDAQAISILDRRQVPLEPGTGSPTHRFALTLAYLEGSGWAPEAILAAAREGAQLLGQCGVALEKVELVHIGAPQRYRDFFTPLSRELARAVPLAKPAVYFVSGTRQRPAFDAEAIGRANSRTRPELADTVWVTRGTRDLGIALAHEIAHVLMDSGEHSEEPGNLMREDTAPENTTLSGAQCARLRENALANGLVSLAR